MSLKPLTHLPQHFFQYFNRFSQTWFDFHSMHPVLVKTTAALTFLGCLAYGVYRFFFGSKKRRRDSTSSSDEDDIYSTRLFAGKSSSKKQNNNDT